jgi:hypothetical protein
MGDRGPSTLEIVAVVAAVIGGTMLIVGSLGTWTTVPDTVNGDAAIKGTDSQPPPFTHEVDDLTGAAAEEPVFGVNDVENAEQEREARPFPKGVPDGIWTLIAGIAALLAAVLAFWRRSWAVIALVFLIGLGAMTAAGIGIHDVKNETPAGSDLDEYLPLGWGLVVASLGAIAVTASAIVLAFGRWRAGRHSA